MVQILSTKGVMHSGAVGSLRHDGIWKIPGAWAPQNIAEFREHFAQRPFYNGHVWAKSDGEPRDWDKIEGIETGCYTMEDAVTAPHFLRWAIGFHPVAEVMMGGAAKIFSVNVFWTQPGGQTDRAIQEFHRDNDDEQFLALFMLGTNVNAWEDGAHLYSRGSHMTAGDYEPDPESVTAITGPAGTGFICNPRGLHMGLKPKTGKRMLAWCRWGIGSPPMAYFWDRLRPVKAEKVSWYGELSGHEKEAVKLVIK